MSTWRTLVAVAPAVLLAACSPAPMGGSPTPAAADARPAPDQRAPGGGDNHVEVAWMTRGYCYAGSRVEDGDAPGGFGPSDNFPRRIETRAAAEAPAVYLLAQPDVVTDFGGRPGMRLVLVNPTGETVAFDAQDSRLSIQQEARDEGGAWRPIESLPSSWCGNSYHRVMLGSDEFWEFAALRFRGSFATELRFRMVLRDGSELVSNVFVGSVNPEQFSVPQTYQPAGLMDPYPAVDGR